MAYLQVCLLFQRTNHVLRCKESTSDWVTVRRGGGLNVSFQPGFSKYVSGSLPTLAGFDCSGLFCEFQLLVSVQQKAATSLLFIIAVSWESRHPGIALGDLVGNAAIPLLATRGPSPPGDGPWGSRDPEVKRVIGQVP